MIDHPANSNLWIPQKPAIIRVASLRDIAPPALASFMPGMAGVVGFTPGAPAGPVAISLTDDTFSTTAQTTFTFNGRAIGAAATTRDVLVVVAFRGNGGARSISNATIGEGAATIDGDNSARVDSVVMLRRRLASGTTADISITFSGSVSHCGIAIYRMTGASTAAPTTNHSTSNGTSVTVNITVPAEGGAVGGNIADWTSVSAMGWSAGLNEDVEHSMASGFVLSDYGSMTSATELSSQAFTATRSGNSTGNAHMQVAVYSPAT